MEKTIATISKNQREEIRIALSEFGSNGTTHEMISARVFYDAGNGEMKPGKNGLNVPTRLLPALVAALRQAEVEARAAGLIEDTAPLEPSHAGAGGYGDNTILGAG